MDKFFRKKDLEFVKKYMGMELAQRWEGVEKKCNRAGTVTIANTGLYSSGKSSLFNALLDQIENERFPVGAIPTTKEGDKEQFAEYVEIIDTPGIDATYEDDEVAVNMIMESDIILITHNLKTGMLNQSEYTWIQNIINHVGKDEAEKRLVFVCTWIDEVTNETDRIKVTEELQRQLKQILGVDIPFWEVSAKRYGVAEKKGIEKLKNASNIPQFRDWLLKRANEYRNLAVEIRKKEVQDLCCVSRKTLQERKNILSAEYERIKREVDRQFEPRKQSWYMILENFKDTRKAIQAKLRELKKEEYDAYDSFEQKIKNM